MSVSVPPLLSVPQLAKRLGCRSRWIEDRVRSGEFPGRKISRRWAFTEDDVQEIIRRIAVPAKSGPPAGAAIPVVPQGSSATRTTASRMRRLGPTS